jgi:hypothetical protein
MVATFQAHTGAPRIVGTMFHPSAVVKQKEAPMKHFLFHLHPPAGNPAELKLKLHLFVLKSDIYIIRHQACYSIAPT